MERPLLKEVEVKKIIVRNRTQTII